MITSSMAQGGVSFKKVKNHWLRRRTQFTLDPNQMLFLGYDKEIKRNHNVLLTKVPAYILTAASRDQITAKCGQFKKW